MTVALNLCHEERMSTPGNDYEGLLQLIRTRVEAADARFGAKGAVGIGFPGIINRLDGSIVAANLPAIHGRHLGADLAARLARTVSVDNDAKLLPLVRSAPGRRRRGRECAGGDHWHRYRWRRLPGGQAHPGSQLAGGGDRPLPAAGHHIDEISRPAPSPLRLRPAWSVSKPTPRAPAWSGSITTSAASAPVAT